MNNELQKLKLPNKGKFRRVKVGAFALNDMIIDAYQQGRDSAARDLRDENTREIAESIELHTKIKAYEDERKILIDRINSVTENQWEVISCTLEKVMMKYNFTRQDIIQTVGEAQQIFKPK